MRKLFSLLTALILLLVLTVPAFAAGGSPKIVDNADLLTASEEAALESQAQKLADKYDIDVVILTVYSLNGKNITAYADDYFDYNGYGIGSDHSGVLLMLSMEYRDWAISTCGDGIDALTDYGQEQIMDDVLDYLGDDEYYNGFRVYLDRLDTYFEAYQDGEPIDVGTNPFDRIFDLLIALGIGIVAGFITIAILKSGMKTVKPQRGASSYVKDGTYRLYVQRDMYLYSNTSRVRKPENNCGSGGHGGSSTHRSSSGRSHGGSRGRF